MKSAPIRPAGGDLITRRRHYRRVDHRSLPRPRPAGGALTGWNRRRRAAALVGIVLMVGGALGSAHPALAAGTVHAPITGSGSTWSANALQQWISNVWGNYRWKIDYTESGSTQGRNDFKNGTADFGVSEIPYAISNSNEGDTQPNRRFAYMPIVAGGTAFMYNLQIGGKRVTNLRLSGDVIAKIFTAVITQWDDAAIKADNPALALPNLPIIPVVRADGSGATAQFSIWLRQEHTAIWDAYCGRVGRPLVNGHCGVTSNYPTVAGSGFVSKSGSNGVSGYVAQSYAVGAITFVEYSYALNANFPVAKVLNQAGYYSEPTASNVAVGLLQAKINQDTNSADYLTQDLRDVYTNSDPRAYPLSSYSYIILPTALESGFTEDKGLTLADFGAYFLCEGQQQADTLGYSPLPVNLVLAGQDQIEKIPGGDPAIKGIADCHNPTLDPSDPNGNALAKNAPFPEECDKQGVVQCVKGTGGAKNLSLDQTANQSDPDGVSGGGTGGSGGGGGTSNGNGAGADGSGGAGGLGEPAGANLGQDGAGLAGDTEVVSPGEADPVLAMAAASPQSIPAPGATSAARLVMLAAGAGVLAATILPPVLGKRGARKRPKLGRVAAARPTALAAGAAVAAASRPSPASSSPPASRPSPASSSPPTSRPSPASSSPPASRPSPASSSPPTSRPSPASSSPPAPSPSADRGHAGRAIPPGGRWSSHPVAAWREEDQS
ncbi:MAG: phosphate ABC transporter substrate-binding protein PstS [Bifidobacteriaceae bacterium]|jgi:phosphate ABC transporter phosphate-binding protein|nr:phosphate ABC transporter substrate-binding protein PstS [Bifidobacteriaceae bacterium]